MTYPIDIREEAGVRTLHFGSDWIQGAMRISRPWHLELEYTRDMMASLLLRDGPVFPRKVLLIGLGAASLTKYLYRNYPLSKLTVVEIESAVVAAARQFFKLPDDPRRLNVLVGDGVDYVMGCDKSWDLILIDGFDADARPGGLDTLPFYLACRARLGSNGILAANLFGRSRGFKASMERIRSAFDERALAFPSCDTGNVIAFAATGHPVQADLDDLHDKALTLKQETGLNLLPTSTRLQQARTCRGNILQI